MSETDYAARVNRPGKFEGEQPYVPYFWDMANSGEADDDYGSIVGFQITQEDRDKFPGLLVGPYIILEEGESGFVYGHVCTSEDEYRSILDGSEPR